MPGDSFDMHESLRVRTIQMVLVKARISDLMALVCSLAALAGYGIDFVSCHGYSVIVEPAQEHQRSTSMQLRKAVSLNSL
jgi:hypothetical protein